MPPQFTLPLAVNEASPAAAAEPPDEAPEEAPRERLAWAAA